MKAYIAETHGQPAETQKLIAYGKVMEDDTKDLTHYKIVDNGFIVMMTLKVSHKSNYNSCYYAAQALALYA